MRTTPTNTLNSMSKQLEPVTCATCNRVPELIPIYASTGKPDAWVFVCGCPYKFYDEFPRCIGRRVESPCQTVKVISNDKANFVHGKDDHIVAAIHGANERHNYLSFFDNGGNSKGAIFSRAPALIDPYKRAYTRDKAVKKWNTFQDNIRPDPERMRYNFIGRELYKKSRRAEKENVTCRYCGETGFKLTKHDYGKNLGGQTAKYWGLFYAVDVKTPDGEFTYTAWKQHKCKHYIKLYLKEGYDTPL